MAPFPRNSRGRSFRGRTGNSSSRGDRTRRTFHSTRIEAPTEEASDQSIPSEDDQKESSDNLSEFSSSEDEDKNVQNSNSYNALLQSLNTQARGSEPKRKKQKVSHESSPTQPAISQDAVLESGGGETQDLDHVDEPEEGGIAPYNDSDQEEDDGDVDCMYDASCHEPMLRYSWRPF